MKVTVWTCILAIAATISSAFAQTNTLDSTNAQALTAFQHAPMRRAPGHALGNGAEVTVNWGGYAVTGTGFTSAKGSWIVPTVNCSKSPNAWVSFWVGIDGYSSSTVEQAGTTTTCYKTTAEYFTWYEFYPGPSNTVTSVPCSPGDKMSVEISYNGSEFTVEITDETTGTNYSITQALSGAERTSAEWIAESPTLFLSDGFEYGITNLADFTTVEFGDDYTDVAGTNSATDSTVSGPISDFGSAVEKITHVDWDDNTQSTTSALSKDGSSFTIKWVESN
jgi:hypothetical protein